MEKMIKATLENKTIDTLRDIPDLIPVLHEYHDSWNIRVFTREEYDCKNYLSPNRRDFYKVLFITKGTGVMSIGLNTYDISAPTIFFIHPNDIISWKKTSEERGGSYCLFKKTFADTNPQLKAAIEKYDLFNDKLKCAIRIPDGKVGLLENHFMKMREAETSTSTLKEDTMLVYLQLILISSLEIGDFSNPDHVTDEYKYVHNFFTLLEQEASKINNTTPISMKTSKEFAANLAIHPNYLNALLKKHTGQNVSTHIRNRLLQETKVLLAQTDWSLQDIGYSIGYAEQSNFNSFFKKNTGITPSEFRKSAHLKSEAEN
jgi:AraC family transcriptional regulator, transcriptional activator of pobA